MIKKKGKICIEGKSKENGNAECNRFLKSGETDYSKNILILYLTIL